MGVALKRKIAFAELIAVLLISAQIAFYVLSWSRLLSDPSLKGMDFISFYTAGRIARAENYHLLFDLDAQRAVQHTIVEPDTFPGGVNLSQHPPYLAPFLSLFSVDDFVLVYIYWSIVRLLVMLVCGEIIRRFLLHLGWDQLPALLTALSSLCFFPFFLGLLGGQDTAFIMLGLLLWMTGLLTSREMLAGLGLAFSSLSLLVAIALGPATLSTRRKAGAWFIMGMFALGLYSLALVGLKGATDFVGLMSLSSKGEGFGLNQPHMHNLLGFLLRNFPGFGDGMARLTAWGIFLASVLFLVMLWWNKRENVRIDEIGLAVVLIVFTLPHLHSHGLSYLLLSLLASVVLLHTRGFKAIAVILIPLVSMVFLVASVTLSGLVYGLYYLLMAALAVGLWLIRKPAVHNIQNSTA